MQIEKWQEIVGGIYKYDTKSCRQEHQRELARKQKEKDLKKREAEKKREKKEKVLERKAKKREEKKTSIPRLEKELDSVFSKYIRLRDALKTTWTTTHLKCFTCDDLIEVPKAHNMHFISRWVKQFRFSEANCRWWCYKCNIHLKWNYIEYFTRLEKDIWRDKIDEMISKKHEIYKYDNLIMLAMIAEYKGKIQKIDKST